MATPTSPVAGNPNPDVPQPGTVEESGVPSGTATQVSGDATPKAEAPQGSVEKLEQDRRRQQAVYDRKLAEMDRQMRELREQNEQLRVQSMDEAQRKEYEATKWKSEYEALKRQVDEQQVVRQYADAFAETFGIDPAELDTSSQEAVAASGWDAVARRMQALQSGKAPAQPTVPTTPKTQPRVLTGSGGVPTTKPTQAEMIRAVADKLGRPSISPEEFYRYMERNPALMNQWLQED